MIGTIRSSATEESPLLANEPRRGREGNLTWLQRMLQTDYAASTDYAHILLVGGRGRVAFRLRVAQSQIRHDLSPSHWSHAFLLGPFDAAPERATPVYEISLEPDGGFGFPPPNNGVQEGRLRSYLNSRNFPNIALLSITMPAERRPNPEKSLLEQLLELVTQFKSQRSVLDALELTLQWLAYAWGTGHTDNPLLDGVGIPSAAMLEMVFGAVGFDLTPGLESRASCPEAIWQAAKWWYPYYDQGGLGICRGGYQIGHRL